jgi:hypothetical protein
MFYKHQNGPSLDIRQGIGCSAYSGERKSSFGMKVGAKVHQTNILQKMDFWRLSSRPDDNSDRSMEPVM